MVRILAATLAACALLAASEARGIDDLDALNKQVESLYAQGKYAEATEIAKRALALTERKFGPDDTSLATSCDDLAELYRAQGRYAEAEPFYKRALSIREKALGPDHPNVAQSLNNLGFLYYSQGRYPEAEPLYKRCLAIREKALGPDHRDVAQSLNGLATLYWAMGRPDAAEPLLKRSIAIVEKVQGQDNADFAAALNNLAAMYATQGRYADAEPLYRRSLAIREKVLGPDHPDVATSFNNLAELYRAQGRYADTEPLLKRSLAIQEKTLGFDNPSVALTLNNLAELYRILGRTAEAEPLYQRALAIREKALGPDHPDVAQSLNSLATLYFTQDRFRDAEPLFKRALSICEKTLGPDHPDVATYLDNLASVHQALQRYAEAEPLFKRALSIREEALGPDHPDVATSLNNLAALYTTEGRHGDAEPLFKRSLAIAEKALGPDHPDVAESLNNLAALYFAQSDWTGAANFWRRSTSVIMRRSIRGVDTVGQARTGKGKSESQQNDFQFVGLVKAGYRLAAVARGSAPGLAAEMFETSQWAGSSEAAASLAQMAARGTVSNTALAAIVRERQDLVAEWQRRDAARSAAVSLPPDERDRQAEVANVAQLDASDARISEIDKQLAVDFPDYAALTTPKPLSVAEVQSQLRANEALVLFLDTPDWQPTQEETFIWAVTKSDSRWAHAEVGTPTVQREVAALRCGLDYDGSWGAPNSHCADLLKTGYSDTDHEGGKPLPFDLNRSYQLYKALFGQVEDVIKGKQLLIIPSGAITQLPFQVLVTEKSDPRFSGWDAERHAAWLIRSHALTVLPSVSSLRALRALAKDSHAIRPLIGFGDPLLDGRPDRYPDDAALAFRARASQSCPKELSRQVSNLRGLQRGVRPLALRGGMANIAQIRAQVPLPETVDELCSVARDLSVSGDAIRLGARATETEIKQLSQSGELAKYRIVHFATHGALAGQVSGDSEPGLLLTPPEKATETDDGYLSASEIAGLKLDADWVILSACNTAAGGAEGAEALSGLARAFFYAGDRALLVSHWAVDSNATVKLITGAISRMAADNGVGRAEAMRQSMLALIDKGEPDEVHPAYWAPFVVVGEGAARSH